VSTITVKAIVFPQGEVYDTMYNAQSTDYIDLSAKGTIVFYINQQQHTDTYDTTKYDVVRDTLVPVINLDGGGSYYVALSDVHTKHPVLEEKSFGIDTESETFYDLKQ
jgi:hypothetical protein